MIDVINLNDKYYVNVDDFIQYLTDCAESVWAFAGESAPESSKIISDTLNVTINTLIGFKDG